MRLLHPGGDVVHLAYCTNVHQAEDAAGIVAQLDRFAAPIRAALDVPVLGLGLWLAADVAHALARDAAATRRLKRELDVRGLEVVTLNAFPYRGFQDPVVKKRVYHPDWTTEERLAYTLDAATVLAGLLPDDVGRGSVSTLPLAWREPWDLVRARVARARLAELAAGLAELAAMTGRAIRVGLEPEPGCVVATLRDAVEVLDFLDTAWLGVCVDACHLAVEFEEPHEALSRLADAGLPVVKAQASSAMEARDPADPETRRVLAGYREPRFLHQTRERGVGEVDDLDLALDGGLPGASPWRIHYHLPVHASPRPPLSSTAHELERVIDALFGGPVPVTGHLEVETYTWDVLPDRPPGDAGLVAGLAAELAWTRDRLLALGLKEL
ncbi:metabolite traffic protein EboE [Actinocorallia sp. A-T 12471]|uniref:metabolite traffic protein EboE n=1 Tax=Actinocorallia sp. A-T 12471 TaxID=3089813 RepID=UPI0029CB59EE|nr:metabolite traffic protein EboE [Actinocorallia sp. A-T 12471]MDX6740598.1 metabolite traffic protein EboE [Actinocorallia sp. A-T 12471]